MNDTQKMSAMSSSTKHTHIKKMLKIFTEGVKLKLLHSVEYNHRRIDLRAYQRYLGVFNAGIIQYVIAYRQCIYLFCRLFRALNNISIEQDLFLIVGKCETVRNSTLFALRHLIEPTGYLKTRVIQNGDVIVVLKDSFHQWLKCKQDIRRGDILDNISDDGDLGSDVNSKTIYENSL